MVFKLFLYHVKSDFSTKIVYKSSIAKKHENVEDMMNRLVDTEKTYDMKINIDELQLIRVSCRN